MVEAPGGFAQTYGVELLYDALPRISRTEIARFVKKHCPGSELADNESSAKSLYFLHRDHCVKLADANLPAQTLVLQTDEPLKLTEDMTESLQQSWSFPGTRRRSGAAVTRFS